MHTLPKELSFPSMVQYFPIVHFSCCRVNRLRESVQFANRAWPCLSKPSNLLTVVETGDVVDGLSIALSAVEAKEKVQSIVKISEIVAHEIVKV